MTQQQNQQGVTVITSGPCSAKMLANTKQISALEERLNNMHSSMRPRISNAADKADRKLREAIEKFRKELDSISNDLNKSTAPGNRNNKAKPAQAKKVPSKNTENKEPVAKKAAEKNEKETVKA